MNIKPPENIVFEKVLSDPETTTLVADSNGIIVLINIGIYCFNSNPQIGANIEDCFPGGSAYLGVQELITIPRVQMDQDTYFSITILGADEFTWFAFHDVTSTSLTLKEKIERGNREIIYNRQSDSGIIRLSLYKIGAVVLEHIEENYFRSVSKNPSWFKKLLKQDKFLEIFPITILSFLESFFSNFVTNGECYKNHIHSDVWIQQISPTQSINLQAIGLSRNKKYYLIVYPSKFDHETDLFNIFQAARDNVLRLDSTTKKLNELQYILDTKDNLISSISRDLHTPLLALSHAMEFILSETTTNKRQANNYSLLKQVQQEISSLYNYNQKINYWASVEHDISNSKLERVSFKKLIITVIEQLRKEFQNFETEFHISQIKAPTIIADKKLIKTALRSLFDISDPDFIEGRKIHVTIQDNLIEIKDYISELSNVAAKPNTTNGSTAAVDKKKHLSELNIYIAKKILIQQGLQLSISIKESMNLYGIIIQNKET
ncbi:MAG: hypothetical protein ACK5M7_07905 [Draconibacterium sp.]